MRGVVPVGLGQAKYNMLQQWLLRLGIVFFAAALGSGAAFASEDTVPADTGSGTTLQQNTSSDVETTTSGDAQVEVSNNSNQSQEGVAPNTTDSGSSAASLPLSSDTQSPSGAENSAAKESISSNESGLTPGASESEQAPVASQSEPGGQAGAAFAVATFIKKKVKAPLNTAPVGQLAHTATAVHTSDAPNTPPTPTGLLGDLRTLLTSSLIPGPKALMSQQAAVFAESVAVVSLQMPLIVLLVVAASLLLISFYLARLRRSGYSDAARSDASAATFYFATPPKMGFMSVPVTL